MEEIRSEVRSLQFQPLTQSQIQLFGKQKRSLQEDCQRYLKAPPYRKTLQSLLACRLQLKHRYSFETAAWLQYRLQN